MKKAVRRLLSLALALAVSVALLPAAYASDTWYQIHVEQVRAVLPEVDMVFYPLDQNGGIYYDMSLNDTQFQASLDQEQLEIKSLEKAGDMSCLYVVLVDLAANITSYHHLKLVKEELKSWVDTLKADDRLLLVTYGATPQQKLDGSETRQAAKTIIDSLETETVTSDPLVAMEMAAALAKLPENSQQERRVMIMIDSGQFVTESANRLSSVQNTLLDAGLPPYILSTAIYDTVLEPLESFAVGAGGMMFKAKDAKETRLGDLVLWLSDGKVLRMEAKSNDPLPATRDLQMKITDLNDGGSAQSTFPVSIRGSLADEQAPTVTMELSEDLSSLSLVFSEDVAGADSTGNYTLTDGEGQKIKISSVSYDDQSYTAVLSFDEPLAESEYSLEIRGVTDLSAQANPLELPDGEPLSFTVGSGGGTPVWIYIVVGAAVLGAIALVVVLVLKREHKLAVQLKVSISGGPAAYRTVTVGNSLTIGKSSRNSDIVIVGDPAMSRCHCQLSCGKGKDKGSLYVKDMGALNGTWVNGTKIDQEKQIHPGDVLTLGNTLVTIVNVSPET